METIETYGKWMIATKKSRRQGKQPVVKNNAKHDSRKGQGFVHDSIKGQGSRFLILDKIEEGNKESKEEENIEMVEFIEE